MNNSGKIAEVKEMKEGERKEILRYWGCIVDLWNIIYPTVKKLFPMVGDLCYLPMLALAMKETDVLSACEANLIMVKETAEWTVLI
jgi:hypothetical protein